MSRITFPTTVKEASVNITMGWDRPLQHCFLQVDLDYEQEDHPDFKALALLSDRTAMVPLTVEEVEAALTEAGLSIPRGAIEELRQHRDTDAGNVIVRFDAQGLRTQLN